MTSPKEPPGRRCLSVTADMPDWIELRKAIVTVLGTPLPSMSIDRARAILDEFREGSLGL